MKNIIRQSSEVSNLELFYDLIFAYAISKIMTVLHTVINQQIPILNIAEFLMMMLVFWTVWTYQTVFANRFFVNSFQNNAFLLFDMFWVMVLSQSLNTNFEATHPSFAGSTSILLISIAIQYLLQIKHLKKAEHRRLALELASILLFVAGIGLITIITFATYQIRFGIYFISWILANVIPIFVKTTLEQFAINFKHLTERYSLFVLLLFGEAVIGVASSIHVPKIKLESILYFIIVVILFLFYILTYDYGLNRDRKNTSGVALMNLHYPIFIGIGVTFTSVELIMETKLSEVFGLSLLTAGLVLFLGSVILLHTYYGKHAISWQGLSRVIIPGLIWILILGVLFAHIELFLIWLIIGLSGLLYKWWTEVLNVSSQ